jgi:UDP-N-acetylglucosamine--N-acetylmuramyl-(pentapeptide) pyrophosphoryl-undecaprenol N-acetylglucosamine transferase
MKLLIAAGGTGGHIFPGISVAEALTGKGTGEVFFAGTPYGLEEKLIPQSGYRLAKIEAKPFLGASVRAKAATLLAVVRGTLQARQLIKAEKPDAVLGMGGFASVPVVLAGLFLRVPCFLHEQNIAPGLANRLLAGRVKAVFVSFAESAASLKTKQAVHTGNPIRKAMRGKRTAKTGDDFTIFVFGGSRGARSVNSAALELVSHLHAPGRTVICHQTGSDDFDRVRAAYNGTAVAHEVFPFTDHMERYYNRADVVVSRSGASTIFELSYFRKPAVFIPYPFAAGGHQWKNASYVERIGGGRVIANSDVSGERLYRALAPLRENAEELRGMGERIGTIYVEDAEEKVIRGIEARVP